MDFANLSAKKVLVLTDPTVAKLPPMATAVAALHAARVPFEVYSDVRVEPKDYSVMAAIAAARGVEADAFLAVGGGSVMDTAKMVNLYTTYPEAEFLDFVSFFSLLFFFFF